METYIIYIISTFISAMIIYHFIILRPYKAKFYNKPNKILIDYFDIKTYKYKNTQTSIFSITSIILLWIGGMALMWADGNYGDKEHYSSSYQNLNDFLYSFGIVYIVFILLLRAINVLDNNTWKNKKTNIDINNSARKTKINFWSNNRWSHQPRLAPLVLMFLLLIEIIWIFHFFITLNNLSYSSRSLFDFALSMIIVPWIVVIFVKIMIATINYFYNKVKNKQKGLVSFKTWIAQSFNHSEYIGSHFFVIVPYLLLFFIPIVFMFSISDFQHFIDLLKKVF